MLIFQGTIVLAETSFQVPINNSFGFEGYLRSGAGFNSLGGKMEAFQAPGAGADKGQEQGENGRKRLFEY